MLLTIGTAWSEAPSDSPEALAQEILEELKLSLTYATRYCALERKKAQHTATVLSTHSHFWENPYWYYKCWWIYSDHRTCKELRRLKLKQEDFHRTMRQFKNFVQTFKDTRMNDIKEYEKQWSYHGQRLSLKKFSWEVKHEITSLRTDCKNMSNTLQKKLETRARLIHEIYVKE